MCSEGLHGSSYPVWFEGLHGSSYLVWFEGLHGSSFLLWMEGDVQTLISLRICLTKALHSVHTLQLAPVQ